MGPAGAAGDQFGVPAAQPPPPPPDPPSPKVSCDDCGFSFIVGDIELAVCPNCEAEVSVNRIVGKPNEQG
jgi:hypothetical protein